MKINNALLVRRKETLGGTGGSSLLFVLFRQSYFLYKKYIKSRKRIMTMHTFKGPCALLRIG